MKDKEKKFPQLLRKKGFYVALYGAVAVMLTVAVVISYNNYNSGPSADDILAQNSPLAGNSWLIDAEGEIGVPEQTAAAREQTPGEIGTAVSSNQGTSSSDAKAVSGNNSGKPAGIASLDPLTPDMEDLAPVGSNLDKSYKSATPTEPPEMAAKPQENKPTEVTKANDEPRVVVIDSFREGLTMDWPVVGEIVMDYSKDHGILDITLEQYRTNESISIAADKGTEVRAASEGMVISTGYDKRNGYFVVIEHGNGWVTTYSQLQENLLVKKDDVVAKGQVIGGVADPSIYSVLLGPHLDFNVRKDNDSKDPKTVLTKR